MINPFNCLPNTAEVLQQIMHKKGFAGTVHCGAKSGEFIVSGAANNLFERLVLAELLRGQTQSFIHIKFDNGMRIYNAYKEQK